MVYLAALLLSAVVQAPDFGVIVEFRDPPLAALSKTADYEATFRRFRADLASISRDSQIGYQYHVVFNGVSAVVPRSAIPAIL